MYKPTVGVNYNCLMCSMGLSEPRIHARPQTKKAINKHLWLKQRQWDFSISTDFRL